MYLLTSKLMAFTAMIKYYQQQHIQLMFVLSSSRKPFQNQLKFGLSKRLSRAFLRRSSFYIRTFRKLFVLTTNVKNVAGLGRANTNAEIFSTKYMLPGFVWTEPQTLRKAVSKRCGLRERIHWFRKQGRPIRV